MTAPHFDMALLRFGNVYSWLVGLFRQRYNPTCAATTKLQCLKIAFWYQVGAS